MHTAGALNFTRTNRLSKVLVCDESHACIAAIFVSIIMLTQQGDAVVDCSQMATRLFGLSVGPSMVPLLDSANHVSRGCFQPIKIRAVHVSGFLFAML